MSFVGLKIQQYHVFKYLGSGGMGDVYAAYDQRLDRRVALKAIRREHRLKPDVKVRLWREARVLSGLEHPHICRIYDLLDHHDTDILVLELIEGESLGTIFGPKATAREGSEMDPLKVAEQISSALAAAHEQGVVHRDLKPDNVMLTSKGDVKVLDFGVARRVAKADTAQADEAHRSGPWAARAGSRTDARADARAADSLSAEHLLEPQARRIAGTPAYMSPEQVRNKAIKPASDMYSLGVLLQEMFTGKPVYRTNSLTATLIKVSKARTLPIEGIDPDLAKLIERLESKDPDHRPSAVEVRERLRWIRAKPQRRRGRALRAAAMVFLVLASATLAIQTSRIGLAGHGVEWADFLAVPFWHNPESALTEQASGLAAAAGDVKRRPTVALIAREILKNGADSISSELSEQPLIRARMMVRVGMIYLQLDLFSEALPLATEALETRQEMLGPEHPEIAESQAHLADVYRHLGRFDDAAPLYESSIRVREELRGAYDIELAASLNGLGIIHWHRGDYETAEVLHLRALEIREKALGPSHPRVADSLDNLALVYRDQLRFYEAEPLHRRSLEIRELLLRP